MRCIFNISGFVSGCAPNRYGLAAALLVLPLAAAAAPPPKPAVLAGHEIAFDSSGNPSQALVQSARAECPPGKGVVAGGHSFSNTGIEAFILIDDHPSGEFTVQEPGGPPILIHDGWLVTVRRTDGKAENWAVQAYAVCVDVD